MTTRARSSLDPERLSQLAEQHRTAYRKARPFPHAVLDNFLPEAALDQVLAEFPGPGEAIWRQFDSNQERKLASTDARLMGPVTAGLLVELNGAPFLDFLRDLTGIPGLVPDPHFFGGGLHQIEPDGFLEVHADFKLHPTTRLERRLNLLLYLNRGWRREWRGALELWNRDLTRCVARIEPTWNRCVIFTTTDSSFHGHPAPLACPPGTTRKSLALYYYSVPAGRDSEDHNTLFQERADSTADRTRHWARELLPPVAMKAAGRARRRWLQRRR
jgi:hypothetical protein